MSTNQTEREVPVIHVERIEDNPQHPTIRRRGCYFCERGPAVLFVLESRYKQLVLCENCRQAIIAALEPERELRERCERLRVKLIGRHTDESLGDVEVRFGLSYGDLTDDLTT